MVFPWNLLWTKSFYMLVAVYILYSVATGFLPLVSNFGFEYSLFFAVIASLLAAITTVNFLHKTVAECGDAPFSESLTAKGVLPTMIGILLVQLAPVMLGALAHGLIAWIGNTTCNWPLGLAWFGLLVPISTIYGMSWGFVIAVASRTKRRGLVLSALVVLFGMGYSVYGMAAGPHCFCYNAFFGYFPGPIYDKVVEISSGFVAFRMMNLGAAALLGLLTSIGLKVSLRRGGKSEPKFTSVEIFFALVLAVSLVFFSAYKKELGLESSERVIRQELSAHFLTPHFDLYFPPDGPIADRIEFFAADHEFRYHQITQELGIKFPRRIHSYIYLTDGQKKRLQGAGGTMYADVSNVAMHMSYRGFPHQVLKHEMTHVITAVWGMPYFGWSSKVGLTEGLATSIEGYREDGSTHQWAAAMKKLDRLPHIEQIMSAAGFWSKSGARSYLAAGSFSLWLRQTMGLEKYRRVYTWGKFDDVYGMDLQEMGAQWEEYLDTVSVSDTLMQQARHKFTRRSIFEQTCARETARLIDKGWSRTDKSKYHPAIKIFEKAAMYASEDPKVLRGLMVAQFGARLYDKSYETGERIIQTQGGREVLNPDYQGLYSARPVVRALAEMARIDWMFGRLEKAAENYKLIEDAQYDRDYTRLAIVADYAISNEAIEPYFRLYLASDLPSSGRAYYLAQAGERFPRDSFVQYLIGRRLFADEQFLAASSHFLNALSDRELPSPLRIEGLANLGQALYFQKRFDEAETVFNLLLGENLTQGHRLEIEEWIERTQFTRDYFTAKIFPPTGK